MSTRAARLTVLGVLLLATIVVVIGVTQVSSRRGLSWQSITAAHRDMTGAQWQAYKETLRGQAVTSWDGKIIDVQHIVIPDPALPIDGYVVSVDLDNDGAADTTLPNQPKDTALNLRRGQSVTIDHATIAYLDPDKPAPFIVWKKLEGVSYH